MAAKTFREMLPNTAPALDRILATQAPTGSAEPERSTLTQFFARDTDAVSFQLTDADTDDLAVGDARCAFLVPAIMNGKKLISGLFVVKTAGTGTGNSTVQFRRWRAGAASDMLTTPAAIEPNETSSLTGVSPVINSASDNVATGDIIYIDIDTLSSTKPKGGLVVLEFGPI